MRTVLNFNTEWLFIPSDIPGTEGPLVDESQFLNVNLPHTNKIFPHHYFDENEYRFVSWYRRHFALPEEYRGKRIWVDFEGVMTVAQVYINGVFVAEHKGGFTPFSVDITDYVNYGGASNLIAVRVDSSARPDIPPEGYVVDYMQFGGIYRNVRLRIVDPLHIDWVFVTSSNVSREAACLRLLAHVVNAGASPADFNLKIEILDADGESVASTNKNAFIEPGREMELEQLIDPIERPRLWDIDNPYLYVAQFTVISQGRVVDQYSVRFGIRTAVFAEDGKFYLNGEPLKLRGLNRHQTYPYLGAAMPDRGQRKDADILRYELGLNIVRTSHYPQAPAFLDRCDEIGLLVFEEIPGWQHIGNDAWKSIVKENLRSMIIRDRNHPSIVLWGVRINESEDDHDLYLETNRIAHELDPSRQTGGVRNFRESEFLEDVYTFNDFSGGILEPNHPRYLVTEFGGHTFPTKSYDNEDRLIEHAKLHASIQNAQYARPDVAGAIGWCAFDYNTTIDFGSGDGICYHGVCDIFRLPKFAAYFYRSQMDPKDAPMVFAVTHYTPGDRSGGGIDPLLVFSNCEEVEVVIDGESQGIKLPNREAYPSLPHPPFEFRGISFPRGRGRSEIRVIGRIGGVEVTSQTIRLAGPPARLALRVDDESLIADGTDCTRLVFEVQDVNGQRLPYASLPVSFELDGPGELIGENPFCTEAGRGAVYVRTTREPGEIRVRAKCGVLPPVSVTIRSMPMVEPIVPETLAGNA
ncbi:MAG TPA: beta-galactosidase [Firmicutes bacterium]|nr:beta-galactosidase [Bacillota bacterium]